jgi:phospholipid transport system substrate-binding protein
MRPRLLCSLSLLVSLGLVLAIVIPVFAGEPTQQITQTTDKILSVLSNPDLKAPDKALERKKQFSQALDERFDWEELSRRSLARHWTERTPQEKKDFVPLYRDLLERTYLEKVDDYSGEAVRYEGETLDGEYATVKVKIQAKGKREIPVEYRMLKKGTAWRVYDITIEGVSLVNNYRQQFSSILQKSTFQEVLQRLREKSSFQSP